MVTMVSESAVKIRHVDQEAEARTYWETVGGVPYEALRFYVSNPVGRHSEHWIASRVSALIGLPHRGSENVVCCNGESHRN